MLYYLSVVCYTYYVSVKFRINSYTHIHTSWSYRTFTRTPLSVLNNYREKTVMSVKE